MLVTWQASFTYDDQLALNVTELDPAIFEWVFLKYKFIAIYSIYCYDLALYK